MTDAIQSNEQLAKHLRDQRDIYGRALEMYRTGQMRVGTNHMDTTTYLMNELQGIINSIDQVLERLDDAATAGHSVLPKEPQIFDGA